MEKKTPMHIPDAELDVMQVLWQNGGRATVIQLHKDLQERRACTKPAVHILVDRLAERGFVSVTNETGQKEVQALVTEEDYCQNATESFLTKICHGQWQRLIAGLVRSGEITEQDLNEIARIVNGQEDKQNREE